MVVQNRAGIKDVSGDLSGFRFDTRLRASAALSSADTPDASRVEAWHSRATGSSPVAWNRSAVVTPTAHGAGATERPDAGRVRPPKLGAASVTRKRVPACRPMVGGSRRRSRRGLPHRMALRVAFGSHPNGRSPIASRPPADRRCGRSPGERPALLDRMPLLSPARGREPSTSGPTLSLSHRNLRTPKRFRRQVGRSHFFQKQAGISPQSPLLIQNVFVDSFVGEDRWPDSWLTEAMNVSAVLEKHPANADRTSGECR